MKISLRPIFNLLKNVFFCFQDCSSFDSGQAPSSVKKTLFGNVVDDLSLSTAADAIALQIPQIFKKFSSNSSINGSRSSLNTIDSNDSRSKFKTQISASSNMFETKYIWKIITENVEDSCVETICIYRIFSFK